eukprot:c32425_g1_i1.p1 GENE.c32425_g1_i1~~c32425_g1_i1.p1  ORF type:complete len:168 (-),score=10.72 c32425_g1_i1:24-527(-)
MVKKLSKKEDNPARSASARGSDLRVHFKNTREAAMNIKNMPLEKAKQFLKDVMDKKQGVRFSRFNGGVGRKAQTGGLSGRYPKKSAVVLLGLLENVTSNAEMKGLDADKLVISHIQVNQAQQQRRRTYRAHGRISAYMSSPCHVELIASEKAGEVKKPSSGQLATKN